MVGFILLFLEILIPSGGILGILSIACTGFGIFCFFNQEQVTMGVLSIVGFGAYGFFMLRFILRRVSFKASLSPDTSTSVDPRIDDDLVHQKGVTVTALRPAGMALINGKKVDVVSIGDFIDRDIPVQVLDISGNRVVVRITNSEEGS